MAQTKTQERTATEIRYPKRYNVIFLNDDFTPVPFDPFAYRDIQQEH